MQQTAAGIAFFVLSLVAPGLGAQRWLGLRADLALVLPLGGAAGGSRVLAGARDRPALGLPAAARRSRRRARCAPRVRSPTPPRWRSLAPAALALAALLAATQFGGNREDADGGFRLDPMGDQPLHAGITWELTQPWPPQVPGLAGVPLHYHFGADLVRAAAWRWAGVEPYALLNRLEPSPGRSR